MVGISFLLEEKAFQLEEERPDGLFAFGSGSLDLSVHTRDDAIPFLCPSGGWDCVG